MNALREAYKPLCDTAEQLELVDTLFSVPAIKETLNEKETKEAIIEAMGKWVYMSGCANPVGARELGFIAKFIFDNYADLNLKELNLSIDLALTGKLDVDPQTYGFFSPAYVARILNAYKDYKVEASRELAIKKANKDMRDKIEREALYEETPEDKLERLRFFIRECDKNLKAGAKIVDFGHYVWNFLKRKELIKLTKEEITQAQIYARQRLTQDKQEDMLGHLISEAQEEKRYAREWCLRRHFAQLDVEAFCNSLTINDL